MSRKRTLFIAAGVLAAVGAAAVSAQGLRGHWRGGPGQFGEGYEHGIGGPGRGFGGHFRGSLTKDEFEARTRERFARMDRNSDGVLDAAEIEAMVGEGMAARRKMAEGVGARGGERLLRRFDANKDGKVTKDELLAGVRKLFAEADLDNDGRITDEDLPPMMRGRNALSGGGAGPGGRGSGGPGARGPGMGGVGLPQLAWLGDIDANKDGVITLDEALAAAEKRFALLDRNKDGAIDQADFDALRKETAAYRVKRFIHHHGADKDGKVTREQFTEKARERFAQMDLNNDGTISRDEMPGQRGWFGRGEGRGSGGPSPAEMRPSGERGPGSGGPPQGPPPDRSPPRN